MGLKKQRGIFGSRQETELEKEVGAAITIIAADTAFNGTLTGLDTVRIAGRFEGTIDCRRLLWVEPGGRVKGTITAKRVINEGEIIGDVLAAEQVEVRSNGRMVGNIHAVKITVSPGSLFDGEARMIRPKAGNP